MNERLAGDTRKWSEITSDEKIERLKDVTASLRGEMESMYIVISELKQHFKEHSHDNGGVKVPYCEYSRSTNNVVALRVNTLI